MLSSLVWIINLHPKGIIMIKMYENMQICIFDHNIIKCFSLKGESDDHFGQKYKFSYILFLNSDL